MSSVLLWSPIKHYSLLWSDSTWRISHCIDVFLHSFQRWQTWHWHQTCKDQEMMMELTRLSNTLNTCSSVLGFFKTHFTHSKFWVQHIFRVHINSNLQRLNFSVVSEMQRKCIQGVKKIKCKYQFFDKLQGVDLTSFEWKLFLKKISKSQIREIRILKFFSKSGFRSAL